MVKHENLTGGRRWRWNTNSWHYTGWPDYARKNWALVTYQLIFILLCGGMTIVELSQTRWWWALYFGVFIAWYVHMLWFQPRRRIVQHQLDDLVWGQKFVDRGMTPETAALVNDLICEQRVQEAAKVIALWMERLHLGENGL